MVEENKNKKIWTLTLLSIVGGVLYRFGGMGAPFNTKVRDFGIPLISCLCLWIWGLHHLILIPTFGLMFASQTSYFKKKGTDAQWYNWLLVGLAFSFSTILISIYVKYWIGFLYRTIVVTAFTVFWSKEVSNDILEEFGRGFIQIATLPLLLT